MDKVLGNGPYYYFVYQREKSFPHDNYPVVLAVTDSMRHKILDCRRRNVLLAKIEYFEVCFDAFGYPYWQAYNWAWPHHDINDYAHFIKTLEQACSRNTLISAADALKQFNNISKMKSFAVRRAEDSQKYLNANIIQAPNMDIIQMRSRAYKPEYQESGIVFKHNPKYHFKLTYVNGVPQIVLVSDDEVKNVQG